jgi:putative peptidoglycan lipid II flippase
LSIGAGACLNALLLYAGLRRRGIYTPAPGWALFFAQLLGACLVLASAMMWLRERFDWIALGQHVMLRMLLLGATLAVLALFYFGMLWMMGFKYRDFRRRVQ